MDNSATSYVAKGPGELQAGTIRSDKTTQQTIEAALSSKLQIAKMVLQPQILALLTVLLLAWMGISGTVVIEDGGLKIVWGNTTPIIKNVRTLVDQSLGKGKARVCIERDGMSIYNSVLWLHNIIEEDMYMAGPIIPIGTISCPDGNNYVQIGPEDVNDLHPENDDMSFRVLEEVHTFSIPPGFEIDHTNAVIRRPVK